MSSSSHRVKLPPHLFRRLGLIFITAAMATGVWVAFERETFHRLHGMIVSGDAEINAPKFQALQDEKKFQTHGDEADDVIPHDGHAPVQNISGTYRQPLQFRSKPVDPAAVLAVLATGKQTVDERVQQLQKMRGISLSQEEREFALAFLAGQEIPKGLGKGSMHWIADELLTVMRLQEPPWDGLAGELAKAAFQPSADPVVRDYIMQHLGHLWEQYGSRQEIDHALWQALGSADETTPGTALIALSRGYQRDKQEKSLDKVRQQALKFARNPETGLAVRVTALSIAGDGGGREVEELAASLLRNVSTPVILKKVAD